jgi:phage-related protein
MAQEALRPVEMYEPVRKLIRSWPLQARQEIGAILTRLQRNELIGMPDIRAMPSVSKGVYEMRVRIPDGAYRVFYVAKTNRGIFVFHAFTKKSQQTPQKEIEIGRSRLNAFVRD